MKIKMLIAISGTIDGQEWPAIGGVIEVADHVGADMILNRFAEVDGTVETAAVDPVKETAAKPAAKTRKA
jgi:hypothetical protein